MSRTREQQHQRSATAIEATGTEQRTHARGHPARALAVALFGAGILAAGCASRPAASGVANLGATTSTAVSIVSGAGPASPPDQTFAFVDCMRTHGEPNMPEPAVHGHSVQISVHAGSGVDPNSPRFTAASRACAHLLPNNGAATRITITPADQADYLKGAACMRTHGVSNFPDPTFGNYGVEFNSRDSIDPSSAKYKRALAICERLIPAGLPYSSASSS